MNRKNEARNPKLETNPKYKCSNVQNMESKLFDIIMVVDSVLVIWILKIENLFRISTCPPLPEMLAHKLNAVSGVGRRVFGFRICFLP
jgi:hypothetical protein